MLPGIYDISNEEYHASEGLSRSAIMELRRSPEHYYAKYVLNKKSEATDSMIIGNAVHSFILEPNKFSDEFAIMPNIDGRTTEGKRVKEIILKSVAQR